MKAWKVLNKLIFLNNNNNKSLLPKKNQAKKIYLMKLLKIIIAKKNLIKNCNLQAKRFLNLYLAVKKSKEI